MAKKRLTRASSNESNRIVAELIRSYNMELETVMNYIACSVDLDGALAAPIKAALSADIPTEIAHAQLLAKRIKTIGGFVPGSLELKWDQEALQPPRDTTDLLTVVRGVIDAEAGAIAQYQKIIKLTDGKDMATQDMAIELLANEQEHFREFDGFRKELEKLFMV
ncbi:MAG: ferritin-like domain-containing protein [Phycisphaerales bacterium]